MASTAKKEIPNTISLNEEDDEIFGGNANVEIHNAQIDESPSLMAPSTLPSNGIVQTQPKRKSLLGLHLMYRAFYQG